MQQNIVLLGAGHTHAHVLKMWRMHAISGCRLVCVSDASVATYSGMLPGTLAGMYTSADMEIDLVRLCASVRATLIIDEVVGIDHERRQLLFAERPPLPFGLLSIGIGSRPSLESLSIQDDSGVTVKPMRTFLSRLDMQLERLRHGTPAECVRVGVVGGGVAGLEIAFCLPSRFEKFGLMNAEISLFDRGEDVGRGLTSGAAGAVRELMAEREILHRHSEDVVRIGGGQIETRDGQIYANDVAIVATSAVAPPLLDKLGLQQDERGFLLTDRCLQSLSLPGVFVVGDSGTVVDLPFPKSGVYAVRQGPVLWENLRRAIEHRPLAPFQPQEKFLKLLNAGDGTAIVSYRGLGGRSRLGWRWKNWVDRKFMGTYQAYEPPIMEMPREDSVAETGGRGAMRCVGCGGKVAGDLLRRVLDSLDLPHVEDVASGMEESEDIAWMKVPAGDGVAASVDFFTPPVDDWYLAGRLSALNAMSDLWAKGIEPATLLAHVTLPVAESAWQEQMLRELLSGAMEELRQAGATLAGGHTLEGARLVIGFSVLGTATLEAIHRNCGLRVGDQLILTKPIGTGVLLAAHGQAACRAPWYEALVASMLTSNRMAMEIARRFSPSACTDVSGFGLGGHLTEMLRASGTTARIESSRIPLLPGALELWNDAWQSTLAPANRRMIERIEVEGDERQATDVLCDPQSSGGLLMGMSRQDAQAYIEALGSAQSVGCAIIGEVTDGQ